MPCYDPEMDRNAPMTIFELDLLRFTLSLQSAVCILPLVRSLQSAVRSLCFTLTGFFKALSIGPTPGNEPATSRSAVKGSTD